MYSGITHTWKSILNRIHEVFIRTVFSMIHMFMVLIIVLLYESVYEKNMLRGVTDIVQRLNITAIMELL